MDTGIVKVDIDKFRKLLDASEVTISKKKAYKMLESCIINSQKERDKYLGKMVICTHPGIKLARDGSSSDESLKKYGPYRFYGKIIEIKNKCFVVAGKFKYKHMKKTGTFKVTVLKNSVTWVK